MGEAAAFAALERLLEESPGRLQIITNLCASQPCAIHNTEQQRRLGRPLEGERLPPQDPRHFVCHEVTRLELPDHRGLAKAHTAEGDWCMARPAVLLRRLLEASEAERGEHDG